ALLARSFAAHLHQGDAPLDLKDLNALGAVYDPASDTPLTAGMVYYHLAYPLSLLRQLNTGEAEILARVIEARIRWLAGDRAAARIQIEDLIVQFAAVGGTEDQMVSLLADAAVLAWRDGDAEAAQGYLIRAQACGQAKCPSDFVFDWLTLNRSAGKQAYEGYNSDTMKETALDHAADLVTAPEEMQADIRREADFATGDWAAALAWAMQAAQAPQTLTSAEQRRVRLIADRLFRENGMSPYLMGGASVASEVAGLVDDSGALLSQKLTDGDVAYIGDALWAGLIIESWPILHHLYQASDRPGDALVAQVFKARLVLKDGDAARALEMFSAVLADARGQGFSDARLHAILMDQWAAAVLAGEPDVAAQARAATAACRVEKCGADITARLAGRYQVLPKTVYPSSLQGTKQAAADAFFREVFPGDFLKLADLYSNGGSERRPMDGARNHMTGFAFAEQVPDLPVADLAQRAERAMSALIRAGKYRQASDIGARTEARATQALAVGDLSAYFYQKWARASFRLGDAAARAYYRRAVVKMLAAPERDLRWFNQAEDLALDLLDTGYDDSLLALIDGRADKADMRARVLFRQGKAEEAAQVYRGFRLRAEAELSGKNSIDTPAIYAQSAKLRAIAVQEAHYLAAAGDVQGADAMRALGRTADWPTPWPDLDAPMPAGLQARFTQETQGFGGSMGLIRPMFELRDTGNYQGAAVWMRDMAWVAQGADQSGSYLDAQTLWQMAFTFARAGDMARAFDLMDRAARIAARLSFEGAGEGTLQLLERDRWRYLLFVDIAWGAVTGRVPEQMLVVSRY
ncbi:hypothetical protein, partial [Pelagimonas varians]